MRSRVALAVVALVVWPALLGASAPHADAAGTYTIIDLGTLHGGYGSSAAGINSAGHVVGGADTAGGLTYGGKPHAFLWQQGVMTNLGTLGGLTSSATGVNSADQVVGWANTTDDGLHAFLWRQGTMVDLGAPGGATSEATGINSAGQVVGTVGTHGVLWQNGTMTDLGTLGGMGSSPAAINDAGQVVGVAPTTSRHEHAFLWQNGVMTDLGTLPGDVSSSALGINNAGQVVGKSATDGGATHAVLWQNGVMTDLGTLDGQTSEADGINSAGQVVGEAAKRTTAAGAVGGSVRHAFLWQNGTMTDLNDLLPPGSKWQLYVAQGINDGGQIVGEGGLGEYTHGYLLSPTAIPGLPSPASSGAQGVSGATIAEIGVGAVMIALCVAATAGFLALYQLRRRQNRG